MTTTVVRGGRLVDETGERNLDLLVDSESHLILEVGGRLTGDRTIDASDCYVGAGLVDLAAQFSEPGNEAAETLVAGSGMAALGGYTSVVALPDSDPCLDSFSALTHFISLAEQAHCSLLPAASISRSGRGEVLSPMAELFEAGVRVFSDNGASDSGFLRLSMNYLSTLAKRGGPLPVLTLHCEDRALSPDWAMHEGATSSELGLVGQPSETEEVMVARALVLGRMTGVPIHIRGVSCDASVSLIRDAKAAGQTVTADVSSDHLVFVDEDCSQYESAFKLRPPLRDKSDRDSLRRAVSDGTVGSIATGHKPDSVDSTDLPFDQAPFGAPGLSTALSLVWGELDLDFSEVLAVMSWQPGRILGLDSTRPVCIEPGRVADLVVFDPNVRWTPVDRNLSVNQSQSPSYERALTGMTRHTIFQGTPTVIDGELTA